MDTLYSDRRGTTRCVIAEIIKAKTTKEAFKNERNKFKFKYRASDKQQREEEEKKEREQDSERRLECAGRG